MNGTWGEYLSFRRMITPVFIQVIFWIFVAFAVLGGIVAMANDAVGQGILLILFGPLIARIYAEILIVIFRINDNVAALNRAKMATPDATAATTPPLSAPPPAAQ